MVIDLAVQLQGKVKDNTPVKTGHLRNEWHVGSIEKRGNEYYIEVYNNVEYVEPVEYGHQTRGGKGFVKGAHMMAVSYTHLRAHETEMCIRDSDGAFPSGSAETPSRLSPGVDE